MLVRLPIASYLLLLMIVPLCSRGQRPITADKGDVGKQLLAWAAEGTAAGNEGDFFDNRDDNHSPLSLAPYPQLQNIAYTDEQKKARAHWGLQLEIRPQVVFGNSSTSAPAQNAGSNPRSAYVQSGALAKLAQQYRGNHLYIYPEHRDHDPENEGGHGDLFPTNTPYLIISQGSSGSDQPFMKAMPSVLAAFRPEVKKRLIQKGLLMPTIQMLFRSTSNVVRAPGDYLTGDAHPTVFEGKDVNVLRLIRAAHDILPESIPPMVQLRLERGDTAVAGAEYFDAGVGETLAETECVIARVYRSSKGKRKLTVSAENSFDLNEKPLQFHWVILRGDPALVDLKPLNEQRSRMEITFRYHPKAPIAPERWMRSNRIDIGVFVHNGVHYSAPGFVTSFTFDNEARAYAKDGRVLEIAYGVKSPHVTVTDWAECFRFLSDQESPIAALIRDPLPFAQWAALMKARGAYAAADAEAVRTEEAAKAAEEGVKEAAPEQKEAKAAAAKVAREVAVKARQVRDKILDDRPSDLPHPVRTFLPHVIVERAADATLYAKHKAAFASLPKGAAQLLDEMQKEGIAKVADGVIAWTSLDSDAAAPLPTAYQASLLVRFQAELLAGEGRGLRIDHRVNLVDFRLTLPKDWRDVYRYHSTGALLGWTRYRTGAPGVEFSGDGLIVKTRDALGRCASAAPVRYTMPESAKGRAPWDLPSLVFDEGSETVRYRYRNEYDFVGGPAGGPLQSR